MGWGSATRLFDAAVDVALKFAPHVPAHLSELGVPKAIVAAVVEEMYTTVDWDDWDTQDESKYFEYLIEVMHERDEIDEEYYNWYKANYSN